MFRNDIFVCIGCFSSGNAIEITILRVFELKSYILADFNVKCLKCGLECKIKSQIRRETMNLATKLGNSLSYLVDARNYLAEVAGQDCLLGDLINNSESMDKETFEKKTKLVSRLQDQVENMDGIILELSNLREDELFNL